MITFGKRRTSVNLRILCAINVSVATLLLTFLGSRERPNANCSDFKHGVSDKDYDPR